MNFHYHLGMNWYDDNRGWNNWITNGCILDVIIARNPVTVLPGMPGHAAGLKNTRVCKICQQNASIAFCTLTKKNDDTIIGVY